MTRFAQLIEVALEEFSERLPMVALPRLLALPSPRALEELAPFQVARALYGPDRALAAFEEGFSILESRGAARSDRASAPRLVEIMAASILDALAVREGELELDVPEQRDGPVEIRLCEERRYLVAGRGERAIIVLNALGVSHHCWSRLAQAGIPDHRLIFFESRSTDIEAGGMKGAGGIEEDVSDLLALIEHERLDKVALLGWCSGARAAVEFAWRHPDRLGQLILLAPTLRQTKGLPNYVSPFEDNLSRVFAMINGRASLARHFVQSLSESNEPPDDSALAEDLAGDARLFLNLPRRRNAALVLQPFVDGSSLLNYVKRIAGDISVMAVEKLASLSTEILIIQGDRDNFVNNQLTLDAFRGCRRAPRVATMVGTGHYPHDLQFHYIRKIISDFTHSTLGAQLSARIVLS